MAQPVGFGQLALRNRSLLKISIGECVLGNAPTAVFSGSSSSRYLLLEYPDLKHQRARGTPMLDTYDPAWDNLYRH